MIETQSCTKCGEVKPLSEFYRRSNGALKKTQSACKVCTTAWRKGIYYANEGNRERRRQSANDYHRRLRLMVVSEYGGKCACCGESTAEFLSIDHVSGGGCKHREEIGEGSSTLYKWLKRNGFPKDGFQLLCFNCNCAKGFYGECPHRRDAIVRTHGNHNHEKPAEMTGSPVV